jgi:hypothetical protein
MKCPKCDKTLDSVNVEPINLLKMRFIAKGAAFVCPHWHAVLSVGLDQLSLQADTISQVTREILKALGRG